MPGQEIVGRVSVVGAYVARFKVGDTAGVGRPIDSFRRCAACAEDMPQYCEKAIIGSYNGPTPDAPDHTKGAIGSAS